MNYKRYPVDLPAYAVRSQSGPCFICQIIAGEIREQRPIIFEDDTAIVFFSKHQLLYGYTLDFFRNKDRGCKSAAKYGVRLHGNGYFGKRLLIAPRKHREAVTADFTLEEYLALQKVVYQVAEALRQEVPTERLYILSLGSQQGNRHVHWHLAPLPPGVPYSEQQLAALNLEQGGLDVPDEDLAALAVRIRQRILKSIETVDA